MPIQHVFRSQKELAEYLERLGKAAREENGNTDIAYGFETAAMLVATAKFEDEETPA